MTRRRIATLVSMVLALMAPAGSALAQGPGLPADVVQSASPPTAQVEEYVNQWLTQLESGDAEKMLQGRDKLLEPLKDKKASVAFRQLYSRASVARLQKLADGPAHNNAINAMRVAGEIATFESGTVLTNKLNDKNDAGRRLFAAAALGRLFGAIDTASPAISVLDAKALAEKLAAAFGAEKDQHTLEDMAQHLITATRVQRETFAEMRSAAFVAMCLEAGKRAQAMKGDAADSAILPTLLKIQLAARESVQEINPQRQVNQAAKKQALELHGRLLGYVVRSRATFPAGQPEKRTTAESMVRIAEIACVLGLPGFGIQYDSQNLADEFKKATPAGDGAFLQKSLRLITILEDAPLKLGPFDTK